MTLDPTLQEQALSYGIDVDYFTNDGQYIEIEQQTIESLLAMLAANSSTDQQRYHDVFAVTEHTATHISLPSDVVPSGLTVTLMHVDSGAKVSAYVHTQTLELELPPLPMGYYQFSVQQGQQMADFLIVVAPPTTYELPSLRQNQAKLTGVTVQLYSLRSADNWGIGDFADLCALVDYFCERGVDFIGLNPLHALFTTHPEWASPYSPSSRQWLNMMYLDMQRIPGLAESGAGQTWLTDAQTQAQLKALRERDTVDYARVSEMKMTALRYAYDAFVDDSITALAPAREKFAQFYAQEGKNLYHHALFEALEHHFHQQQPPQEFSEASVGWLGWPEEYRYPDSEEVTAFAAQHSAQITFFAWIQWLINDQLAHLRDYAEQQGMRLGLYGDLAVGVSRGGSDTWVQRDVYCMQACIGAPPDALGPNGQNWNLPPWHPRDLKAQGFQAFIDLLRVNMRHYGVLRIDHVMAMSRLWWIAFGQSAVYGAYVRYPLDIMMAILALESHRHQCTVIGEDLGIVSEDMNIALHRYQLYSYTVLYFLQEQRKFIAPSDFPAQAIAVVSTHDVAPLRGYWHEKDLQAFKAAGVFKTEQQYQDLLTERQKDKAQLLLALQQQGLLDEAVEPQEMNDALLLAIHLYMASSRAKLFGVQLENLIGMEDSFNLPGVTDRYPNWSRKLPLTLDEIRHSKKVDNIMANIHKTRQATTQEMTGVDDNTNHIDTNADRPSATAPNPTERLLIDEFFYARVGDPFAYLGLHQVGEHTGLPASQTTGQTSGQQMVKDWVVRALLPLASEAWVIDKDSKNVVSEMTCVDERGFFIGQLDQQALAKAVDYDYQYLLRYTIGEQTFETEDPYRFPSHLQELDNWLLAEGTHLRPYEQLGAHWREIEGVQGVNFCVWAPGAIRVSVVGDFNAWDGRRHTMRFHAASGIWEIFVPDAAIGQKYKFEILGADNHVRLKADPYAFASEFRPGTASVIAKLPQKVARSEALVANNQLTLPISVYEVHLGSWRRNTDNNYWLSYDEVADELIDYVKDMGFTHIEFLPLTEFPYDGSWGYQPTGLYSPTSRFGDPDGLKRLIDKAHDNGINVILDWVVGHFPTDEHGLARFDGTALYEHADPREGYHQDWNTLIYNYGRFEVRNYLTGNALYWIERFGFDGLRVDAVASMVYRDYSRKEGQWLPNVYGGRENLEAIEFLRRTNARLNEQTPYHLSIAEESTSFQGVTHDTAQGGLGFGLKWNMGWMNDTLRYMQEDPVHRKYHHNLMTFGMMYQYSENFMLPLSHDEVVHGKGSILARMPGDTWQQFANIRAYYGFMWGYPGKKLLFMGNEFAQGREWNNEESLDWFLLGDEYDNWHKGVQSWVRNLNLVYQQHPSLYQLDQEPHGFEWLVADDSDNSVYIFERRDRDGNHMIVIANFTPVVRENYRFGITQAGAYKEILNSDDTCYNGSGVDIGENLHSEAIASHGREHSLQITIPPLATVFLQFEG